jgi:hypothetical protein
VSEDLLTDRDVVDVGADRLDDARGVAPHHERVPVLEHLLQRPRDDVVVERVEGGGADAEEDLPGAGGRDGQLRERGLLAGGAE